MPKVFDDKEIVSLYRETLDNNYLNMLLEKYEPYTTKIINSIFFKYSKRYDYEDIRQEVVLEFIRIVRFKFNLNSNNTFFTYLYKVLRLASLNFIRDDKYYVLDRDGRMKCFNGNMLNFSSFQYNNNPYNNDTVGEQSSDLYCFLISKNSKEKYYNLEDDVIKNATVEKIKEILTEDDFEMLYRYFVQEESQVKIAKSKNVNQTTISKNIYKKIEKIEEEVYLY